MSHDNQGPVGWRRLLLSTTPALLVLLCVLGASTAVLVYSQLSRVGESWFPDYNRLLRVEPERPDCNPVAPEASAQPSAPAAPEGGDEVLDLLGGDPVDPAAEAKAAEDARRAGEAARKRCEERHAEFASIQARRTPEVLRFRSVEAVVEQVRDLGLHFQRHLLLLMLLICGATATALRGHIGLRSPHSRLDHYASEGSQLLAMGLLGWSVWSHKQIDQASGVQIDHPELYWIWLVGIGVIVAINIHNMIRLPADLRPGGPLKALLAVPLFATMTIVSGVYMLVAENHPAGLSIYLTKLTEFARLYLQVGLYVWIGMLLKQTRLARLMFDLVRPWRLPPELLAFVVVVGASLPTAYSGASGIFVIAVGSVIYEEMRHAGARRQLAFATTAMSGSLGVVLSPCLLVVIVASLNKQVTTDLLYGWGFKVFLLTTVLFLVVSLLNRQGPLNLAPAREAIPGSMAALRPLVPYLALGGVVTVFYALALDARVDENSAPYVLPTVLLALLWLDRRAARRTPEAEGTSLGFNAAVQAATSETTVHIGALLMLMGMSICVGGVIERADLMSMVPQHFGSAWTTMGLMIIVLIVIGMTMDPYGAVILVSATFADVAYRNGIDPTHFWMTVLVAFELGYLTPPVALNQLLTRQVVGDDEADAGVAEGTTYWRRHERTLAPVAVMGTALLVVGFGPLFFY